MTGIRQTYPWNSYSTFQEPTPEKKVEKGKNQESSTEKVPSSGGD